MSQGEPLPASTAAERNREPILEVLKEVLPHAGAVLEVASGTGVHVVHFAQALAALNWQPSEADPDRCALIAARVAEAGLANLRPPLALDAHQEPWPLVEQYAAVVCINMIHIAPYSATAALLRGAQQQLQPGGILYLYGPFMQGGQHTAPSNAAFDKRLRGENPEWGVRDLEDVSRLAAIAGFGSPKLHEMPVNNLSVIYRRPAA